MKHLFLRLSLIVSLPVSSVAQNQQYDIEIKLEVSHDGDKVFLRYFTEQGPYIDSGYFTKGISIIEGTVPPKLTIARIWLLKKGEDEPQHENTAEVWLEPGIIKISAREKLAFASSDGSPVQKQFSELQAALLPVKMKNHLLNEAYEKAEAEKDLTKKYKLINEDYPALFKEKQKVLAKFIKKYPFSLLSAYKFDDFAGDGRMNLAIVEPVYAMLDKKIRRHPLVEKVATRITINKKTAPGMNAIEFSQKDTSGNQIHLSSFKGKYVLIDFWAGWCVPCRAENPQLRKLYDQCKTQGFEILGVSLDGERKRWTDAIIHDKLAWTQVSDLNIFENEVAVLYGITSIPQNILIGPGGKIIDWNLRGTVLEQKLEHIFK